MSLDEIAQGGKNDRLLNSLISGQTYTFPQLHGHLVDAGIVPNRIAESVIGKLWTRLYLAIDHPSRQGRFYFENRTGTNLYTAHLDR